MGKETKKTPIVIDGVEYIYEEMTDKQKVLVNHIDDLARKIRSTEFNLDQLRVGQEAFVGLLKKELEAPQEKED